MQTSLFPGKSNWSAEASTVARNRGHEPMRSTYAMNPCWAARGSALLLLLLYRLPSVRAGYRGQRQ